jgi:hypothetical protein
MPILLCHCQICILARAWKLIKGGFFFAVLLHAVCIGNAWKQGAPVHRNTAMGGRYKTYSQNFSWITGTKGTVKTDDDNIWIKRDQLDVTCFFLFHYFMLNMFRMLIHPSSGACYLLVELFHGLYCSGTMCVGVTVWFGWGGVVSLCRLKH